MAVSRNSPPVSGVGTGGRDPGRRAGGGAKEIEENFFDRLRVKSQNLSGIVM